MPEPRVPNGIRNRRLDRLRQRIWVWRIRLRIGPRPKYIPPARR
ncbi:MAG TPA: hypothetical protein VG266_10435 [Candidatus Dormibacteraeota bacterium]|nr:hypothetical protein [Candidatus Dormibacteraeota bacterium]